MNFFLKKKNPWCFNQHDISISILDKNVAIYVVGIFLVINNKQGCNYEIKNLAMDKRGLMLAKLLRVFKHCLFMNYSTNSEICRFFDILYFNGIYKVKILFNTLQYSTISLRQANSSFVVKS